MKNPLILCLTITLSCFASRGRAAQLYATQRGPAGSLFSVNQTTGHATPLGDIGVEIRDLAFDARPGHEGLWAIGTDFLPTQTPILLEIDPITTSVLSSKTVNAPEVISTLGIDPNTGTMYGVSGRPSETNLYRIDPSSGSVLGVGDIGTRLRALAFGEDGRLFGAYRNLLVEINPIDASTTTVTDTLFPDFEDMAFRPSDGTMFGIGGKGLFRLDVNSGAVDVIADSLNLPTGLAFVTVPEPTEPELPILLFLVYCFTSRPLGRHA